MADDRPLPEPTPEQFRQEYEQYRSQRLLLHNSDLDDSRRRRQIHPRHTITRLVEGDLIPVTDRAGQQLAKRCADLYDSFMASATTDTDDNGVADNNHTKSDHHTTANNHPPNEAPTITPQTTPQPPTTHLTPQASSQTHPHPTLQFHPTPQPLLHIPASHFHEYTTALHNLLTPPHPAALTPPTAAALLTPTHLARLHHGLQQQQLRFEKQVTAREAALAEREGVVGEREGVLGEWEKGLGEREVALERREGEVLGREAAAVFLFDEGLLAGQLAEVRRQGVEEGRREGGGMYGQGNGQVMMPMGSYLAVVEGVLEGVRKARAVARCPPPVAEVQLGQLEAQLVRLVEEGKAVVEGRAVTPGSATTPSLAAPIPARQAQDRGNGRQRATGDGRPLVDKGKGRVVTPSLSGNWHVEMQDGAALLADLKKKARMLGLMGPVGEGSAASGVVDEEDLEMTKLVNMEAAVEEELVSRRT